MPVDLTTVPKPSHPRLRVPPDRPKGTAWHFARQLPANLAMQKSIWPQSPDLTPEDRVLLLSPHPDDETLGAGGLLARASRMGLPRRLIFLTNGDGSEATRIREAVRRPNSHPKKPATYIGLALKRQKEGRAAAAALGFGEGEIAFFGYPDGGISHMCQRHWSSAHPYKSKFTGCDRSPYNNSPTQGAPYSGERALADLVAEMRALRPTLVLTTHAGDTHADHRAAYTLCHLALEQLRSDPETAEWAKRCRFQTFMVHYGPWPAPTGYRPSARLVPPAALKSGPYRWEVLPLTEAERHAKRLALECYKSQLATTPRYLRSFVRMNELFDEMK